MHHPFGELVGATRGFGPLNNYFRRDDLPLRRLPAQQRFRTAKASGGKFDLGLVVQFKCIIEQCLGQLLFQPHLHRRVGVLGQHIFDPLHPTEPDLRQGSLDLGQHDHGLPLTLAVDRYAYIDLDSRKVESAAQFSFQ